MATIALILVAIFVLLLLGNVPIAVAIGLSAWAATYASGINADWLIASKMANGVNSFALLAIPFFILSGYLMGKGGMARRLIEFASSLVGMFPGGLAYVNVLTCMLFGSISGSAAAAVSSVGGFMIPEMNRKGYDRDFNVAVTTTAATTGLLIPPSNSMIVYSVSAGSVSIAAMFMAGVIPGIISGLAIMLVCGYFAFVKKYKPEGSFSFKTMYDIILCLYACTVGMAVAVLSAYVIFKSFSVVPLYISIPFAILLAKVAHVISKDILLNVARKYHAQTFDAFPSLLLVIIVMGGILGGVFTPTEAAAISVLYSFILAVCFYREVKLSDLPAMLKQTGVTTAVVMLLIGASSGMSWIMTVANIPQTVSAALMGMSDNPIIILLTINIILLLVGTFMDMTPAILIFTPIFLPVVQQFGMHPVHFGIMIIANLCIGLCTPPVGTCLFIGCGVGQTTIAKVTKSMIPFFLAMLVAVLVISYVPQISLWLPEKTGLIKSAEVEKTMQVWNEKVGFGN